MNNLARRVATVALAASALGSFGLATAGTAAATSVAYDGYLDPEEMGFYYNSDQGGCVFDLYDKDQDFNNNNFKAYPSTASCNGKGQVVGNNTASYKNRTGESWYVHTGPNSGGTYHGEIPAYYVGNASVNFKNNIESACYIVEYCAPY
ncbi:hypothetical protein [Streptomyces sp. NRRL B-24572]|uniref:hypothetical protein n=1 Tax=Streptomyces sp. NRRL B-24572 TaxID=1962156 RepID=UPI000A399506|nr:hypothetical protein [Streptomyces sp. NRRL B-24572]